MEAAISDSAQYFGRATATESSGRWKFGQPLQCQAPPSDAGWKQAAAAEGEMFFDANGGLSWYDVTHISLCMLFFNVEIATSHISIWNVKATTATMYAPEQHEHQPKLKGTQQQPTNHNVTIRMNFQWKRPSFMVVVAVPFCFWHFFSEEIKKTKGATEIKEEK